MKKDTFKVLEDPDGQRYLHQVRKELDKNQKEDDLELFHEARIYENPGKFICIHFLHIFKSCV